MSKEFDTWFSDDGVSNESWTRVNVKQDMEAAFTAGRALGRDEGLEEAAQRVFDDDSACIAREGCANIDKMKAHLYTAIRALKEQT